VLTFYSVKFFYITGQPTTAVRAINKTQIIGSNFPTIFGFFSNTFFFHYDVLLNVLKILGAILPPLRTTHMKKNIK
jgi:hypothetical protein